MARQAGLDRPILHGLCTYGLTGRALLHAVCDSDPSRFGGMSARFSAPVLPGQELTVHAWIENGQCVFQTRVGDTVVLDRGVLALTESRWIPPLRPRPASALHLNPNGSARMSRVPLVDYLVLDGEPHLVAAECTTCGARFFDRRSACARCGGLEFESVDVPREGVLTTFTIVQFAAEGVEVPFVAGVVDCGGTSVKGNVVNVPPAPEHVRLGMKVRLTTVPVGVDADGVEAVGYGFEPMKD